MGLELLISQFGVEIALIIFIVGLVGYIARTRNDTRNQVERDQSDTRNAVEKVDADARHKVDSAQADSLITLVGALNKLVDNLGDTGKQAAAERQQTLMAIEKNSGISTGMMAAIVDVTKTSNTTAATVEKLGSAFSLQLDEFGVHIKHLPDINSNVLELSRIMPSLETNLGELRSGMGESIADQLGPIVEVLTGIRSELKDLATDVSTIDNKFTKRINELLDRFVRAEAWLMKELTPIAEEHIQELLSTANHKDTTQETPTP